MKRLIIALVAAIFLSVPSAFCYEASEAVPSRQQLDKLASAAHPRLVARNSDFASLKKAIKAGKSLSLINMDLILTASADRVAAESLHLVYEKDRSGRRILAVSRDALEKLLVLSYAWRLNPDKKYVRRAESILRDVCSFPNWNNSHFLDTAEMTAAVARAYDWMYKALSPEVRELAEKTVLEYALRDGIKRDYLKKTNNWNQVCNAGILCGAIAFLDKYPEIAGKRITEAIASNSKVMENMYEPDGIYPEGPTYWGYGTMFQILLLKALQSGFGTDFGLSDHPGFKSTGRYQAFCESGTKHYFNYYDCGEKLGSRPELWYFAANTGDWDLVSYEIRTIEAKDTTTLKGYDRESRLMPIFIFDIARMDTGAVSPSRDGIFYGQGKTPLVIARYGWDSDNSYFGMKAGCASDPHAHMDAGSFVYDAYGYRWASDPVKPSYSFTEYHLAKYGASLWSGHQDSWRWKISSYNNFYHNTISVNGKYHKADGRASLIEVNDTPGRKGGTVDLTAVLSPDLEKAVRTGELISDGSLEIRDELMASTFPAFIRWTFVTPARAEVREDGIHLFQGDVEMLLKAEGTDVCYRIWPDKDDPSMNEVATFDPGAGKTVCGFTFTIAAKSALTVTTSLRKL